MLSMTFAVSSRFFGASALSRARALGLLAALVTGVTPAVTLADTGAPGTPGYTGDVNEGRQADAPAAVDPAAVDPADEYADNDPSALDDFRDTLDPHGSWVQDPTYGTIWVPSQSEVGADFAPYQTDGHWAVADSGDWMWASDYAWGAVPFHYGRWVWAGSYWGWIPGRTYAPAWVTWRVGEGGYIGWAPLPPSWYWSDGVAVGLWAVPFAAYCFVPTSYVFYSHVSTYVVRDRGGIQTAAGSTRPYHAATPTTGHGHPAAGGHNPQHRPQSPSFAAAHVPPASIPQRRAGADARAMSYATKSATAASHRSAFTAPNRGGNGARPGGNGVRPAGNGNAWNRSYDSFGRSSTPASRATGNGQQRAAGRSAPPPSTFHPSPSSGSRAAPGMPSAPPSFHSSAPPSSRSAPPSSRSAPPSFHSSAPPSFHPSAPAPSFHSSAPTYHAPTSTPTTSRPAAPKPSGGSHGGGRRR